MVDNEAAVEDAGYSIASDFAVRDRVNLTTEVIPVFY